MSLEDCTGGWALEDQTTTPGTGAPLDPGAYIIIGRDATLAAQRNINAALGTYTWTGNDAALRWANNPDFDPGAFTITGFTLPAVASTLPGIYGISGAEANLFTTLPNLDPGILSLTGFDIPISINKVFNVSPGSFTLTLSKVPNPWVKIQDEVLEVWVRIL